MKLYTEQTCQLLLWRLLKENYAKNGRKFRKNSAFSSYNESKCIVRQNNKIGPKVVPILVWGLNIRECSFYPRYWDRIRWIATLHRKCMTAKPQDVKAFYGFLGEFVIINITKLHSSLWSKLYFNFICNVSTWLYCHSLLIFTE
jgi:hypothetical protein